MTTPDRPRYLRSRANRDGSQRHYWWPDDDLQAKGWKQERLSSEYPQAVARAAEINALVDAWRAQGCPPLASTRIEPDEADEQPVIRGSVAHLIRLYKRPPIDAPGAIDPADASKLRGTARRHRQYRYASLKLSTRNSYDDCLRYLRKWLGPVPVRKVDSVMVLERLDALAQRVHDSGPHAGKPMTSYAHQVMRVGRVLFGAARTLVSKDHPCWVGLDANPFRELGMAVAESNARLWTRQERDALISAARAGNLQANDPDHAFPPFESIAAAITINWWIGQREADVLGLPPGPTDAAVHTIVQEKTTASVHLPMAMVPEIVEAIARLKASNAAAGLDGVRLLIDEETRLTWTGDRFRRAFLRVRRHAAMLARQAGDHALATSLDTLQFQWLRHTAVVMQEEAGCTVPEIASITGHTLGSVTQILERYGRRTRKQAENALRKRLEGEGAQ